MNAWKQIYATYLDRKIGKVMYWYLTLCVIVVGGMYVYIYYAGTIGFAVLLSVWAGAKLSTTQPPITIVQAFGMILIVRFTLLGGIDAVAKRTPDKIEERLTLIEDKLRDMHTLAFSGFLSSQRVRVVKAQLKQETLARKKKEVIKK